MSLLETRPWTLDEFFAWQAGEEERYELVNGFPAKMMTGASNRHDVVTSNIQGELRNRLKGKPCRPFTGDGAVETLPGQVLVWSRGGEADSDWTPEEIVALPLAELYDRLSFPS